MSTTLYATATDATDSPMSSDSEEDIILPAAGISGLTRDLLQPVRSDSLSTWDSQFSASGSDSATMRDTQSGSIYGCDKGIDDVGGPAELLGVVGLALQRRSGNVDWCTCGACDAETLANEAEHTCCQE